MAQGSYYVTQTTLDEFEEVRVDGRSVIEAHAALQATLRGRAGREPAELLAEPVVTRGNDAVPTSISWYAPVDAEPVRLTGLDPGARAAPEARLREQLAALAGLLGDPEVGPLLGGSLYIGSLDDVFVLDGRPLLTNWGVLPRAAGHTARAREEHFRQTLGRYMALSEAPPLSGEDWRARHGGGTAPGQAAATAAAAGIGSAGLAAAGGATRPGAATAAVVPPPAAAAAAPSSPAAAGGGDPPAPGPAAGREEDVRVVAAGRRARPWVAPLVATLVLAAILVFLLLPGVLLYPAGSSDGGGGGARLADDLGLRRDVNDALQERVDALRGALAENACLVEGDLGLPGDGTDGAAGAPGGAPGRPSPQALVPPPPEALAVPPADGGGGAPDAPGFTGTLVDLLDRATVLVVAAGQNGGIGSGFLVAPGIVVTNRHVIEGAAAGELFVTNQALGGAKPARLLHSTSSSEIGQPDFAVLEVAAGQGLPHLALANRVARLDNVVAGGYPGVILDTDVNFQALRGGDASAIPQMAVSQGVVTVIQQSAPDLPIIIHTANTSPGNSGGPLVDGCGRVVGVNTFIRVDQDISSRLNYALQASSLATFLRERGVAHSVVEEACRPQLAVAAPRPDTAPPALAGTPGDDDAAAPPQADDDPVPPAAPQ